MSVFNEIKEYMLMINEMWLLVVNRLFISVLGKDFLIYLEVFYLGFVVDIIEFVNREIFEIVKGELVKKGEEEFFDFLEVGCGVGYILVLVVLVLQKCYVWVLDVNEVVVKNIIENVKIYEVEGKVNVVIVDVFNYKIFIGKKFDMIYWNLFWGG